VLVNAKRVVRPWFSTGAGGFQQCINGRPSFSGGILQGFQASECGG
jgi:hypothetical protein